MTCRLSLAITSSHSLRCYAAGATYEIVDAISRHNQASVGDKQIVLDILAGIRTGASIAGILKQTLAPDTGPAAEPYDHLLYRAFVEDERPPSTDADEVLGNGPVTFVLKSDLCTFAKSNSSPTGEKTPVMDSLWLSLPMATQEGMGSRRGKRELNLKLPVILGKSQESKESTGLHPSIQNCFDDQAEVPTLEVWHEVVASTHTQPPEGTSQEVRDDADLLLDFAAFIAQSVDLALTPTSRLFLFVGDSIGFSEVCCVPANQNKGSTLPEGQDVCSPRRTEYRAPHYEVNVNHYELAGLQLEAAKGEFGRYYRDHDYNVGRRHAHTVLTEIGRRAGAVPYLNYSRRPESLASGPRMTLWLSR